MNRQKKFLNRWTATLNQSNVARNNNKYYTIQLLEHDKKQKGFVLWTHWGRVGYAGQNAAQFFDINKPLARDHAQKGFKAKFLQKTGNNFGEPFNPLQGKYCLLDMASAGQQNLRPPNYKPSVLPLSLQDLLEQIFDEELLEQEISEIGYDNRDKPLGMLSEEMLDTGENILRSAARELRNVEPSVEMLQNLTSQFYTLIPHNIGFKNILSCTINTPKRLAEEYQLLIRLRKAAEFSRKLEEQNRRLLEEEQKGPAASSENNQPEHPHDIAYRGMNCIMQALKPLSKMHKILETAAMRLHSPRHGAFALKLEQVFAVGDSANATTSASSLHLPPLQTGCVGNRQLLWYGAPVREWAPLLTKVATNYSYLCVLR